MLISRLPRRYEKVIHYEVVKCVKCGSISVVKAHFQQPVNTDLLAEFESYFEKLVDSLKSKILKSHLWDVYE